MAAPSEHGAAAVRLMAALAATWFLKAAAAAELPDPTEWTPDECQCDADPAVVALCGPTTLYPPGVVPADWETVGDQYYDILTNASLSEEERQAQYAPLVNQSGLDAANFSLYTTKYAALKRLPSASQLSSASSYCSVQYNNITGYMPCRCTGGGMAELGLTLEDPSSAQFEADSENAKQQVLTVLEAKLRETLGLWYTFVSIDAVQDTNVTVHVTFSALNREKIEQRFPDIEGLLGQPGNLSLANGSQITLGPSTLALRVLACSASSLTPTSDLPSEATAVGGGEVLAGARARFTCPDGQRFSSGARTVSRLCTSQEQLQAGTGDQLTCVNVSETTTATTRAVTTGGTATATSGQTGSSTASSASSPQSEGSTTPSTTYEPEQYDEINVEWNDGKSFKKIDPNKPNLLLRITVPAASVIFAFLVLYLLCTRPESCMCNACGGGKLSEIK